MTLLVGSEVAVTEVAEARDDVHVLVEALVDGRGDDVDLGEASGEGLDTLRARDHIEEDDVLLLDVVFLDEDLDGTDCAATSGQHGVHQKHPPIGNVLGHLAVVVAGIRRLLLGCLVSLNQDLADANGTAGVAEGLLERFAGTHDAHTADGSPRSSTVVGHASQSGDVQRLVWQEGQSLFHDQAHESVSVEHKVLAGGVAVADLGLHNDDLTGLLDEVNVGVSHGLPLEWAANGFFF